MHSSWEEQDRRGRTWEVGRGERRGWQGQQKLLSFDDICSKASRYMANFLSIGRAAGRPIHGQACHSCLVDPVEHALECSAIQTPSCAPLEGCSFFTPVEVCTEHAFPTMHVKENRHSSAYTASTNGGCFPSLLCSGTLRSFE